VLEGILASGGTASDCHQHAQAEWGLGERQARRLIASARGRIRQDWEIERPQMIAEMLAQLSTLQREAGAKGQLAVALGAINSMVRLAGLI
jgi:hypothetical protein